MWEYGAEGLAEPVSIQDLIVTTVVGSLVGEYLFRPWRDRIRAQPGPLDITGRAALALTDPLGAVNGRVDRWLGVKSSLQLLPMARSRSAGSAGLQGREPPSPKGWRVSWRLQWRRL